VAELTFGSHKSSKSDRFGHHRRSGSHSLGGIRPRRADRPAASAAYHRQGRPHAVLGRCLPRSCGPCVQGSSAPAASQSASSHGCEDCLYGRSIRLSALVADRRADAHPEASELGAAEEALGVGAGVRGGANRPGVFLLVNGLSG